MATLRTLVALLVVAAAQAFVVTSTPVHRAASCSTSALSTVSMQESLDKVSKVTLAGSVVGVALVGVAALTSASGSPPGGIAFAVLAFAVLKLAADAGGLD